MAGMGRVIGAMRGDFQIPAFEYTGDCLTRLQVYNNVLYAEWELRTSGTLVFVAPQTLDAMLVGGGGLIGTSGSSSEGNSSTGGSAFYTVVRELTGVTSAQALIGAGGGDTRMTVNGSTYIGQRGGSGNGGTGGIGHNGPYRLFDEPGDEYILGTGSNGSDAIKGLAYVGAPGNGLLLSKIQAGGSYTTLYSSGTYYKLRYGGIGYGAGQGAAYYYNSAPYGETFEPYGNPGVVLVRVKLS